MTTQPANLGTVSFGAPTTRPRHGVLGVAGFGLALLQLLVVAGGYHFVWTSLREGNVRVTMNLNWQMFAFAVGALALCFVDLSREVPRRLILPVIGACLAGGSVVAALVLGSVTWGAN